MKFIFNGNGLEREALDLGLGEFATCWPSNQSFARRDKYIHKERYIRKQGSNRVAAI